MAPHLPEERSSGAIRRFEAKVRKGCLRCGLEEWRGPLLVGFSGGADSTALLISLASLISGRGRWPSSLIAVHVHHGLRPLTADRDAAHAENFCLSRKIPFRRIGVSVDEDRGLEAAAREARRGAFLKAAEETGARAIALAHTLDDQAETVLMRFFEGAGPKGLAGIRPRAPLQGEPGASIDQDISVVRPLLEISKNEVVEYLMARGTEWMEDETNSDERRLRNLVRRRILPVIRENMGESAIRRIVDSSDHVAEAAEALAASVEEARRAFLAEAGETIRISPLSGLALLPQAVRAGLWEIALNMALRKGSGKRKALERLTLSMDHLALRGGPSVALSLPGKMEARRNYDSLILGPEEGVSRIPGEEVPLAIPGRTLHPGMRAEVEAVYSNQFNDIREANMTVVLDAARLQSGAVLRGRQPGDRFHLAGAPGDRKLKDFFIDRKVPLRGRDYVPIIASGNEVIWVVGHAVSEKYMAKPRSDQLLILKARFLSELSEF
ncbi:tRNA lysidine(34) synthetase TilS [Nitrospinota bacterium]